MHWVCQTMLGKTPEVEKVASINWGIPHLDKATLKGERSGASQHVFQRQQQSPQKRIAQLVEWVNMYHISASWRHNLDIFEFSKHCFLLELVDISNSWECCGYQLKDTSPAPKSVRPTTRNRPLPLSNQQM